MLVIPLFFPSMLVIPLFCPSIMVKNTYTVKMAVQASEQLDGIDTNESG